jgi:protocatechuate 3,4-dioxygenase beta subunit
MGRNISVMRVERQRLFCAWAGRFGVPAGFATFLFVAMATSRLAAAGDEVTYSFAGTVVDPQGRPVADAKVSLIYYRSGTEPGRPAADAVSDPRGKFAFSRKKSELPDRFESQYWSDVRVMAVKDGYGFAAVPAVQCETTGQYAESVRRQRRLQTAKDKKTNVLTLAADDLPVRGRLVNTEGRAVVGAKIEVLGAWAGDNGSLESWEKKVKGQLAWQNISVLFRGYAGAGAMMYENGRRVFSGLVAWYTFNAVPIPAVHSDADGRFTIRGLGRERLAEIAVNASGSESILKLVRTRRGEILAMGNNVNPRLEEIEPNEFTLVLGPAVPLAGRVVDAKTRRPLAGVRVRARDALFARAVTDAEGKYRLDGVPPETTDLVVCPPEGSRHLPGVATVKSTAGSPLVTRDIALTEGVLVKGRAIDERTGKPVPGRVAYFAFEKNPLLQDTDSLQSFFVEGDVRTDAEGRFEIAALPGPGILAFSVEFSAGGQFPQGVGADRIEGELVDHRRDKTFRTAPSMLYADNYNLLVPVNPRVEDHNRVVELKLRSGVDVSVRVAAFDWQPLGEYYVLGARDRAWWTPFNEDRFTIAGCFPTEMRRLFFYQPARNLVASYDLTGIPPEPPQVTLRLGGTIAGRVLDQDGNPVQNANISGDGWGPLRASPGHLADIERNRGVMAPGGRGQNFSTDAEGRFELKGIIPRFKYTGHVMVPTRSGNRTVPKRLTIFTDVTVKAGETKQLGDLRLKPQGVNAPRKISEAPKTRRP